MGGKSENGITWIGQLKIQWHFIDMLYNRVKKRQLQDSIFKVTIQEGINSELARIIGESYGVKRLKGNRQAINISVAQANQMAQVREIITN